MPIGIFPRPSSVERFVSRIEINSTGCWVWSGCLSEGYGVFWDKGRKVQAHRFSFAHFNGCLPEHVNGGLEPDHTCRNRACVNPDHLELVTHSVNVKRGIGPQRMLAKTHCPHGHPYDEQNTYVNARLGYRACKECKRENTRKWLKMERLEGRKE